MTKNTKSFIKNTILGLLGGGTVSALYALNNSRDNKKVKDTEFDSDRIVVPLSRRNFMKAVRSARTGGQTPSEQSAKQDKKSVEDVEGMNPRDLASLKKSLLNKKAGSSSIKDFTHPFSTEMPVRRVSGVNSTYVRDKKGRFASEGKLAKHAGIGNDASGVIYDKLGLIGGVITGVAALKMVSDRIQINRRKKQVESSRRKYVDTLAREVNDVDLPYYNKSAADRGFLGSTLGLVGLTGLLTSTVAGTVMYRIMENRRREEEKIKDKDLSKYPAEKTINFRFARDKEAEAGDFFA